MPEPEVTFTYVASVREPHPDGVTVVTYQVIASAGWRINQMIIDDSTVIVSVLSSRERKQA